MSDFMKDSELYLPYWEIEEGNGAKLELTDTSGAKLKAPVKKSKGSPKRP